MLAGNRECHSGRVIYIDPCKERKPVGTYLPSNSNENVNVKPCLPPPSGFPSFGAGPPEVSVVPSQCGFYVYNR